MTSPIRTIMLLLVVAALAPPPASGQWWDTDTGREAALVGGGLGLWAASLAAGDDPPLTAAEAAALDPAGLNALDRTAVGRWSPRAAKASDRLVWTVSLAPVGLMAAGPGRDQAGRLALMYAETLLLTSGTVQVLKGLTERPRPYAYGRDPRVPDHVRLDRAARRSFPSGHTAQAFAAMVFFAGTFARLNPDSGARTWVWGGCLGAAATTGWLRYQAGRHFPTDILAGAAVGAAWGWAVPALHETDGPAGPAPAAARLAFALPF